VSETPETRYAKTPDGAHVAYQTLGEGPTDLVFLPFLMSIDVMWDDPPYAHVLHRMATIARLICLEPRGLGTSDPVSLGALPTLEAWAEDVVAVLDAVGSRQTIVLGQHMLGFDAMMFAAAHPERTSGLILIDARARVRWAEDYPIGAPSEAVDTLIRTMASAWGTGALAAIYAPSRAEDDRFRRWMARLERSCLSPGGFEAIAAMDCDQDLRAVLPTISVPTLVLSSHGGAFDSIEHGRYLANHIRDSRLCVIAGTDYFQFSTDTGDEVVDCIEEFITGVPPTREPDRVLATISFTDICASTEKAAALGDRRWKELLAEHERVVHREVQRHRGHAIKDTGDGNLSTFDGPARAVRCALSIRDGVRPLGIEMRAGLHTGEVELAGEDIRGIAVHIAARVSALARPAEVLVSRTVTDLVAGSGITFSDRGEHELKGVTGTWRLFAVEG
jgi:class 3 adenylate cyclase